MSNQTAEPPRLKYYQIAIRPQTDIREPAPGFIAALAEQFDYAAYLAEGRIALTVPGTGAQGDDTPKAIATVLHAAAEHRTSTTDTRAEVSTGEASYGEDGHWHIVAHVALAANPDAPRAQSPAEEAFREVAARRD